MSLGRVELTASMPSDRRKTSVQGFPVENLLGYAKLSICGPLSPLRFSRIKCREELPTFTLIKLVGLHSVNVPYKFVRLPNTLNKTGFGDGEPLNSLINLTIRREPAFQTHVRLVSGQIAVEDGTGIRRT